MSPADELRAAAARLEELAAGAKPGPWQQNIDDHGPRNGVDHSVWSDAASNQGIYGYVVEYLDPHDTDAGDTAWIAALGPQVAGPLAAWLRAEADVSETVDVLQRTVPKLAEAVEEMATGRPSDGFRLRLTASSLNEAVAFARAINGTTS